MIQIILVSIILVYYMFNILNILKYQRWRLTSRWFCVCLFINPNTKGEVSSRRFRWSISENFLSNDCWQATRKIDRDISWCNSFLSTTKDLSYCNKSCHLCRFIFISLKWFIKTLHLRINQIKLIIKKLFYKTDSFYNIIWI